jgi:hypothetical protein
MSTSPIVDENYRLHVADLEGMAREVEVANVTYQGVEEMTPVLHFVGQSKRMVMSPQQVSDMLQITGTILYPRWIGTRILLQPYQAGGDSFIRIRGLSPKARGRPMPAYLSDERRGWLLALSVVGIILLASLLIASLNLETLLATVQQVRDIWLVR